MACLIGFLQVWQPERAVAVAGAAQPRRLRGDHAARRSPRQPRKPTDAQVWAALLPWIIVCVVLLIWGTDWFKGMVNPCGDLELSRCPISTT